MKLIVTLSGKSERFTESGYPEKQLVRVLGKSVLEHVVEMYTSICPLRDMYFILKDGDIETHKLLTDIYGRVNIRHVEPHSRGPCYSVLQCDFDWMEDEEIIVSYCDIRVEWDAQKFISFCHHADVDGAVITHSGFHPHRLYNKSFAFIKNDMHGNILGIQEKIPYTDNIFNEHASSGIYYFKRYADMKHYFQLTMDKHDDFNGEYYVTIPYNHMIRDGKNVKLYEVNNFFSFGTPRDIELLKAWETIVRKSSVETKEDLQLSFSYWNHFLAAHDE